MPLERDPHQDRDVHVYDTDGHLLGGFILHLQQYITVQNFYDWWDVFFVSTAEWFFFHLQANGDTGAILQRSGEALVAGNYVVLGADAQPIVTALITEKPVRRVMSTHASTRRLTPLVTIHPQDEHVQNDPLTSFKQRHFREAVRARDGACAMSGYQSIPRHEFSGLQAVHIYPVACQEAWAQNNYKEWITDDAPASQIGSNKIYSPQNGLLLNLLLHHLFDNFKIAVNVDDSYRIVSFDGNSAGVGGNFLSQTAISPAESRYRVSDDALRWHFRQAVLTHMKGAGQKSWEHDFGGGDAMAEILESSDAAERMEVELHTRLDSSQYYDSDEESDQEFDDAGDTTEYISKEY